MSILRSFDVNKPGTEVEDLLGGVVGGSVVQGIFKRGEEIEIKPGIKVGESNRVTYERLVANVETLQAGDGELKQAMPGGLVAVGTDLDPSITKSDGLVGNVLGRSGTLPDILEKVSLDVDLFERAVGTDQLGRIERGFEFDNRTSGRRDRSSRRWNHSLLDWSNDGQRSILRL